MNILGQSVSRHISYMLTSSFVCIYENTYGVNRSAYMLLIIRLNFVSPDWLKLYHTHALF